MSILITDHVWEQIRASFTEDEKVQLRAAFAGEVICPRGITVDDSKLPAELSKKLAKCKRAIVERGRRIL